MNKLEKVLEKRKIKQRNQSDVVKKILASVKRNGDKAVIKYEKKFSKIKSNSTKIKFSKKLKNDSRMLLEHSDDNSKLKIWV